MNLKTEVPIPDRAVLPRRGTKSRRHSLRKQDRCRHPQATGDQQRSSMATVGWRFFPTLRLPALAEANYLPGPDDIYVSPSQVRRFGLRTATLWRARSARPRTASGISRCASQRHHSRIRRPSPTASLRHLTPLYPERACRWRSTVTISDPTLRVIDLITPIGKGQRALIVRRGHRQNGCCRTSPRVPKITRVLSDRAPDRRAAGE